MSTNATVGLLTDAAVVATESLTCEQCRLSSPLMEAFQLVKRGRHRLCMCPRCAAEEQHREALKYLVGLGFFVCLGGFAVVFGGKNNYGWLFLNFALINVMSWVFTIPHEAGHAIAARVMGLTVYRVVLGTGRLLKCVTVMGTPVEIRAIPVGGLTYADVRVEPWVRSKRIVIFAAGPLVDFGVLCIVWAYGIEAATAEKFATGPAPVCALIVALVLALLFNLTPFRGRTHAGIAATDGAQLLSLIFLRQHPWEQRAHSATVYRAQLLAGDERPEAECFVRSALEKYPEDPSLLLALSVVLLQQHRYSEGREVLLRLWEHLRDEKATELQALVCNNIAWADIHLRDSTRIEEARRLSAAAYRLVPWQAYASSTYGSCEALHGDAQAAVTPLERARSWVTEKGQRASVLAGLAVAYARVGNRDASAAALAEARACDASCPLLEIARGHLEETVRENPR